MSIGTFVKQPGEVLDYTTSLKQWLPQGDFAISFTTTASDGITVDSTLITDEGEGICVWLSGGTSGKKYKIQVQFVTDQGRTKEYEFFVKVKES